MTMPTSPAAHRLRACNAALGRRYGGERAGRQPVHTVYGGAHLFRADSAARLGALALRALEEYAPDAATLAEALGVMDAALMSRVYERVVEKLRREPVEDFRLDYEDGYGARSDAEEDGHAESGAREVARGLTAGSLPPFIGLRVKTLSDEWQARSFRTLRRFLSTLLADAGRLPDGFVVTLPKIMVPEHVALFAEELDGLESELGLASGALRFEVMIETPQIVLDAQGRSPLPLLVDAARGRLSAAHFGTYDYTAGVSITAAHQRMHHPACVFARGMMQVAFAGTGVWLSDGSTTVMPVPVHRGERLSDRERSENLRGVHRAWRMHFDDVSTSLAQGFYQGWDLHPAQLVTRYAALYVFFLAGLDEQAQRLRNFVDKAAQATLVGDVFDDAATGQGLLNSFLRAVNCAAISEEEAARLTGLHPDELRGRSFVRILENRRQAPAGAGPAR
jgi:citrate lyase beta subunit